MSKPKPRGAARITPSTGRSLHRRAARRDTRYATALSRFTSSPTSALLLAARFARPIGLANPRLRRRRVVPGRPALAVAGIKIADSERHQDDREGHQGDRSYTRGRSVLGHPPCMAPTLRPGNGSPPIHPRIAPGAASSPATPPPGADLDRRARPDRHLIAAPRSRGQWLTASAIMLRSPSHAHADHRRRRRRRRLRGGVATGVLDRARRHDGVGVDLHQLDERR